MPGAAPIKDIYQRYHAMQGHDQRYQNGFDCQGLWVEVEVEKELGFNSKREIEDVRPGQLRAGLQRARAASTPALITEQSSAWASGCDWDNSYYTMSDTNIEYIWHFLKKCHENGWLYRGTALDALVLALRHVALPARDARHRQLQRRDPPLGLPQVPLTTPGHEGE